MRSHLSELLRIDVEDDNLVGNLFGTAERPWVINNNMAACGGYNNGSTTGANAR